MMSIPRFRTHLPRWRQAVRRCAAGLRRLPCIRVYLRDECKPRRLQPGLIRRKVDRPSEVFYSSTTGGIGKPFPSES